MTNRNYSRELDRIIRNADGKRPRVLLHACCGPCSTSVLEYMSQHFDLTVLWYNPNIYPQAEYEKRLAVLKEVRRNLNLSEQIPILEMPWRNEDYESQVKGLENEPEHGSRCDVCFRVRLTETARQAKKLGFDYFCTTLTVSRYKNAERINAIGERVAEETGAVWLPSDFKKKGGEMRSKQLSNEMGIYQQNYCGCRYSLRAREQNTAQNAAQSGQQSAPENEPQNAQLGAPQSAPEKKSETVQKKDFKIGQIEEKQEEERETE